MLSDISIARLSQTLGMSAPGWEKFATQRSLHAVSNPPADYKDPMKGRL
jgi:hypothetical protein